MSEMPDYFDPPKRNYGFDVAGPGDVDPSPVQRVAKSETKVIAPVAQAEDRVVHFPKDAERFVFDETVAPIFDNMAARSIPGYLYYFERVAQIIHKYPLPKFSQVWDIGISTGAGIAAVKSATFHPFVEYFGTDISDPMLAEAAKRCPYASLLNHDITQGFPEQALKGEVGAILLSWTLQFISPDFSIRAKVIKEAFDLLAPGGWLFVGEKYKQLDPDQQEIMENAYYAERVKNGYSVAEIKAKSAALENSMWPWTHNDLRLAALEAGFDEPRMLFQQFNFAGFALRKAF